MKESCPYKRKVESGVWEEFSIPNARRGEETRLGRGSSQRRGVPRRGFSPSWSTHPDPIHPTSPVPPESYVQKTPKKRGAGGREGDWVRGRVRGKPSPVLPPPGDRVM